jgi:hypothetical protein
MRQQFMVYLLANYKKFNDAAYSLGLQCNHGPQVHFSHPQQPDRPSLSGLTFTVRPGTITVRLQTPYCKPLALRDTQ